MIQPEVPEGTQASVFAVFDDKKKLQFVGFSKDVRNSLRTVFSRRPDKAFFFKCAAAPKATSRASSAYSHMSSRQQEERSLSTHFVAWQLASGCTSASLRRKAYSWHAAAWRPRELSQCLHV